jgi:ABC-type glycerol-3-phosphate transport system permease component
MQSVATTPKPEKVLVAGKKKLKRNDRFWVFIFVTPNLVMYSLFILIPSAAGVLLSFCEWNILGPISWVGLDNYRRLFDDELLIPAFVRTFKFVALGVLPTVFGGFLVAVLLNWKVKGIGVFRAMFFLPLTISSAVAGIAWSSIFNPEAGWINRILEMVGITGPEWLSSFTWALPSVTIIVIWLSLPLVIILYLAGLQRISPEIMEAAALDGANVWQRLWQIIFPCVSATTTLVVAIEILAFLSAPFEISLLMVQGGPLDSTTSLAYYAYKVAFEQFEIGYSAALVMLQFFVLMSIVVPIALVRKYRKAKG